VERTTACGLLLLAWAFGFIIPECPIGSSSAQAQSFSVDGFYDCDRATNGKAYCKKTGKGDGYFQVTDAFLAKFNTLRAGASSTMAQPVASAQPNVTQTQQNVTQTTNNNVVIQNLTNDASETKGLIELYKTLLSEQTEIAKGGSGSPDTANDAVVIFQSRIKALQNQFTATTTELSTYQTSIRPNDPDLRISARKTSELFPKVPWYIPGTIDTGEFWIEPTVTDTGVLSFNMKFVDPNSVNDKVRSTIPLSASELGRMQQALLKLVDWSKTAHQNHVRSALSKRVVCFPEATCPPEDGPKRVGVASTEVVFEVNEDGATSGRIQRNKGKFDEGYNISIDSAIWLQAYLNHVLNEGSAEFESGTRSMEETKALFR
jgi:hypothetical protein